MKKIFSGGVAPCNIKGRKSSETLKLVSKCWLHGLSRFLIGLRSVQDKREGDQFQKVVLHGETLVFVTTAIVATVAEVESGSTFRETCLATVIKKVLRNRPCYKVKRLLKHVPQRRCTRVSARSFNV